MAMVIGAGGGFNLELSSGATGKVSCTGVTSGRAACGDFQTASPPLQGGTSCQLPNPAGSGFEPASYPSSVTLYEHGETTGATIRMSVLVTEEYAYARHSSKSKPASDGTYRDVEYALYGSLRGGPIPPAGPGACKPTTCDQQGKTCGPTSDGCGNTLSCGGCAYPRRCGAAGTCELPPNCNLQPCYAPATVAEVCCSPGQVTCVNGRGCTCYDACY